MFCSMGYELLDRCYQSLPSVETVLPSFRPQHGSALFWVKGRGGKNCSLGFDTLEIRCLVIP